MTVNIAAVAAKANKFRQDVFYTDVVDLYKPLALGINSADVQYDPTPAFVNVKCRLFSTPEVDIPTTEGLSKEVNIFTLDNFHFVASSDAGKQIRDTWLIHLTTPGHPLYDQWWYVEGNPQYKLLMDYASVYGKEGPSPFV